MQSREKEPITETGKLLKKTVEILGRIRQLEHTGNSILEKRESGRAISGLERVHLEYPIG